MLALLTALAVAQTNPYLEQARAAYHEFDYARCLKQTDLASRLESDVATKAGIEILHALCAFELGRRAEAAERLELALRIDANAKLPDVVSPKMEDLFQSVRKRLAAEPRSDVPAVKPPAAANDTAPADAPPVEPPPPAVEPSPAPAPHVELQTAPEHHRTLAASIILAAAAGATVAFAGWAGTRAQSLAAENRAAVYQADIAALGAQAKGWALAANTCFAAAGALVIAAVLSFLLQR